MEEQLELFPLTHLKTVLDEAEEVIYGDRENTHGHPSRNLGAIAAMWQAYINVKLSKAGSVVELVLEDTDVCAMMNLLKVARFANDPTNRDNVVDGIGYWALVERCENSRKVTT